MNVSHIRVRHTKCRNRMTGCGKKGEYSETYGILLM